MELPLEFATLLACHTPPTRSFGDRIAIDLDRLDEMGRKKVVEGAYEDERDDGEHKDGEQRYGKGERRQELPFKEANKHREANHVRKADEEDHCDG